MQSVLSEFRNTSALSGYGCRCPVDALSFEPIESSEESEYVPTELSSRPSSGMPSRQKILVILHLARATNLKQWAAGNCASIGVLSKPLRLSSMGFP
jgi:hypothetical protein